MKSVFRITLLLFCLAAALPALGSREKKTVVKITGTVRLVGSEPFSELVISGTDDEWYIDKDDEQKLWNLQQRTVTVEGKETVKELKFANGRSAGERRILRDIKIITVE